MPIIYFLILYYRLNAIWYVIILIYSIIYHFNIANIAWINFMKNLVCCSCLFTGLCFTVCSCVDGKGQTPTYSIRFYDYDNTPLGVEIDGEIVYEQKVNEGESAISPQEPTRENYRFDHWEGVYTNVVADADALLHLILGNIQ